MEKKSVFKLVFLLLGFAILGNGLLAKEVTFKWYGQSCFLIKTSQGTKIVMDPVSFDGYRIPADINPDIVTISHDHDDHNRAGIFTNRPQIFKGVGGGFKGRFFKKTNKQIKDVHIKTIRSSHDQKMGQRLGLNAIFILEFDGLRLAHLGDLGENLSDKQLAEIGQIDILMIPTGGKYTISLEIVDEIINNLNPKLIVFPMHYKTQATSVVPYPVSRFLQNKKGVIPAGDSIKLNLKDLPDSMKYVTLNFLK